MTVSNYAMIPDSNTQVFNTIVADEKFSMDGYFFILIEDGVFCEAGNYYNKKDGNFYSDEKLTELAGTAPPSESDVTSPE